LHESKPQSRTEVLYQWLDEVVQPGRVVGIGRSGRRLVLVTEKRQGNIRGIREDGRSASFALERIGRVYSPSYRLKDEFIEAAFEDVRKRGKELVIPEPRLRDAQSDNGPMGRPEVLLSASTRVTMAYESISGAVEEIVLAT